MELRAFEVYIEDGRFYPVEPVDLGKGRLRAALTLLEPAPNDKPKKLHGMTLDERMAWLDKWNKMIENAQDEPDFPILSRKPMRPPHGLADD